MWYRMGVLPLFVMQDGGTSLFRGARWGYTPVWGYRMGVLPLFGGATPIWGFRMGVDLLFRGSGCGYTPYL